MGFQTDNSESGFRCNQRRVLPWHITASRCNNSLAVKNATPRAYSATWPLIVAFCIAIALVSGINVLWWKLDHNATRQADLVDHTHQVLATLEEILSRASDMLVGQRGYALTHDKEYLQPFFTATNRMPVLIRSMETLTQDNPVQRKNLNSLEGLLAQHERMSCEHLDELVKGDPLAPDLEFRRKVKESQDGIHAEVDKMVREENRLLVLRRAALNQDSTLVGLANIFSGLLSAGLLVGVFTALWRENARRRIVETELWHSQEELENRVQERTLSLSRSEERLRLAQQAARIGAFEWNAATEVDTWSPELEAMYGLPPGGFARTIKAWQELIHPEDRANAVALVQRALETGLPTEGEWRVIWPDRSVHWMFGRWQAFKDKSGKPVTMTGVNIDITERKRLERELIETSDNEMRRIGHDLHDGVGQQLTALALSCASMQHELQSHAPQCVDSLKKLGSELHDVIRQIRMLSHGMAPVSFEENGLAEALRRLANNTSSAAKIKCEFEEPANDVSCGPDAAGQLYRIGQEAVTNALKHGHASEIRISLDAGRDRTELRVSDNGKGFAVPMTNGQGLGLHAMKYRADVIGAELRIESQVGKGTRITCTLRRNT
jgi:PAS domain S-box-containing protein